MKREHHHLNLHPQPDPPPSIAAGSIGGDMDELLAVLGYKVRSSDMAEVAQKLEQLEEVMMGNHHVHGGDQGGGLSQLASETIHYNPSDLSTWLGSMISELHPDPIFDQIVTSLSHQSQSSIDFAESSTITTSMDFSADQNYKPPQQQQQQSQAELDFSSSCSDYDLKAIPGKAIYSSSENAVSSREKKRFKPSPGSENNFDWISSFSSSTTATTTNTATRPVVVVDSQENGIRLVHALMACAEAVQRNNLNLAEALVKQIGFLAISQAGAMGKVATFFAEALARRILRQFPPTPLNYSLSNLLQMHFYESAPYLKFAHFTANQAILEAFEGKKRVHVIDFSINQGMQWPALIQALALRQGGPPAFRLTGIGPPAPDNSDYLQEVGWKLAQLADRVHVEFEYRGFVANSIADLDSSMLYLRPSHVESVAVSSVSEMHKLLARPGAMDKVLSLVKEIKPEIVTVVEQEANHNGPVFLDRFTESLHYYSTLFDSLEGSVNNQDKVMTEMYLGEQICNVVTCEGVDRVERHEPLIQWRARFVSAGLEPVHLGSNAFKQASMLLALFGSGDGYRVEENDGCLMLGWHSRPLIATSAWRVGDTVAVTH